MSVYIVLYKDKYSKNGYEIWDVFKDINDAEALKNKLQKEEKSKLYKVEEWKVK